MTKISLALWCIVFAAWWAFCIYVGFSWHPAFKMLWCVWPVIAAFLLYRPGLRGGALFALAWATSILGLGAASFAVLGAWYAVIFWLFSQGKTLRVGPLHD